MPKKESLSFLEQIRLLRQAGLESFTLRNGGVFEDEPEYSLSERMALIKSFLKKASTKKKDEMYCFIMYDITDNKIRNYIAKYLLKMGCQRVQKSVYMANMKKKLFKEVFNTLKEVNDMYENQDSIFFIPIGENHLAEMKMVGKNIDYSIVTNSINTLFI